MITIYLEKPHKNTVVTYHGELVQEAPGYRLIHARWERPLLDLGYMTFATGDHFYEHYYTKRWYAVFEIRDMNGILKGWYCNVTRPARFEPETIRSEDLDLDLFVSPDRTRLLRLDIDEFEARSLACSDPATYAAAYAALEELEQLAQAGQAPFDMA